MAAARNCSFYHGTFVFPFNPPPLKNTDVWLSLRLGTISRSFVFLSSRLSSVPHGSLGPSTITHSSTSTSRRRRRSTVSRSEKVVAASVLVRSARSNYSR